MSHLQTVVHYMFHICAFETQASHPTISSILQHMYVHTITERIAAGVARRKILPSLPH